MMAAAACPVCEKLCTMNNGVEAGWIRLHTRTLQPFADLANPNIGNTQFSREANKLAIRLIIPLEAPQLPT